MLPRRLTFRCSEDRSTIRPSCSFDPFTVGVNCFDSEALSVASEGSMVTGKSAPAVESARPGNKGGFGG